MKLQRFASLLGIAVMVATALCDSSSIALAQGVKRSWGPEQATGPPDTPRAGDIETAWASATPDEQDEWLELEYAEAVWPTEVLVYETFNPGALCKVSAFTETGMEAELWSGKDPIEAPEGSGVAKVEVKPRLLTRRIRIYLKSTEVAGWNEIDAVGVKDTDGKTHWAVRAKASSTYAERGGGAAVEFEAIEMLRRADDFEGILLERARRFLADPADVGDEPAAVPAKDDRTERDRLRTEIEKLTEELRLIEDERDQILRQIREREEKLRRMAGDEEETQSEDD